MAAETYKLPKNLTVENIAKKEVEVSKLFTQFLKDLIGGTDCRHLLSETAMKHSETAKNNNWPRHYFCIYFGSEKNIFSWD